MLAMTQEQATNAKHRGRDSFLQKIHSAPESVLIRGSDPGPHKSPFLLACSRTAQMRVVVRICFSPGCLISITKDEFKFDCPRVFAFIKTQAESYVPRPHLGVRCSRATESLLTSAAPSPQNVRHWTPALRGAIPNAIHQQIKRQSKTTLSAGLLENKLFYFDNEHPHFLLGWAMSLLLL